MAKKNDYSRTLKLRPIAYGQFKMTEEAIQNTKQQLSDRKLLVKDYFKRNKNHAAVLINPTEKTLIHTIPIEHKGKMFISNLHLLPILYFNLCSDLINMSENIIGYIHLNNKDNNADGIIISPSNYNSFLSYKICSIIMLHTAIDATINYVFPNDKKYFSKKVGKEIDKAGFEDLPFMDKIKECFREVFDYNICDEKSYNIINEINRHRVNLIHLNTTPDKLTIDKFFGELGGSLNINVSSYLETIINLFKKFRPDLFIIENSAINHSQVLQGENGQDTIYYPIINNIK